MTDHGSLILLPGGLWSEGVRYQEVEILPLTGKDQEFLRSYPGMNFQEEWSTLLLGHCIKRIGSFHPITPDHVKDLTLGDRECLLLHIRRLTFGDKLNCVIDCSDQNCEGQVGVEININDLLLPAYKQTTEFYQKTIHENGDRYKVIYRLPTGSDLEEIVSKGKNDHQAAARKFAQCCTLKICKNGKEQHNNIPSSIYDEVISSFDELDPQAELGFSITCPECNNKFNAVLDTGIYFRNELNNFRTDLYNEVHFLAYHYHWSEQEILEMSIGKRRMYCDLLMGAISDYEQG